MTIRPLENPDEKSRLCEAVLRSLPAWFGIESAILDYIQDIRPMKTWGLFADTGEGVGFLSLNRHSSATAEIHVMGLKPEFRGRGWGRALIATAEENLRQEGARFLTVKTLSESRPDEGYDQTRRFYLREGFAPLEEFKTLWGEANPCLMLVKALQTTAPTRLSHVELSVSDYGRSVLFYQKILEFLGWRRLVCQQSHTTFSDGGLKLVLCPVDERHRQAGFHRKRVGLNHLAFYAPSKEAVDRLYHEVLVPSGIAVLYEGQPRGEDDYYAVFFEDPDRIKIEVVHAPGYCEPSHWTNRLQDDFDPSAAPRNG